MEQKRARVGSADEKDEKDAAYVGVVCDYLRHQELTVEVDGEVVRTTSLAKYVNLAFFDVGKSYLNNQEFRECLLNKCHDLAVWEDVAGSVYRSRVDNSAIANDALRAKNVPAFYALMASSIDPSEKFDFGAAEPGELNFMNKLYKFFARDDVDVSEPYHKCILDAHQGPATFLLVQAEVDVESLEARRAGFKKFISCFDVTS